MDCKSIEFKVNLPLSERFVACRMAMLAGVSGPLSWDKEEGGRPFKTDDLVDSHTWFLGNDFMLVKTGDDTYRLSHPEADFSSLAGFLQSLFK